jgi:hypothetical protein
MGHYKYAIDAKKVGSKNKRSQDVISYACSGIAQDFGVACLHANNCKWTYA